MGFDHKVLDRLPPSPGVYLMRNSQKEVVYVGKANDLKKRVKQYFSGHDTRPMIPFLLEEIAHIETLITSNPKEALLIENNLIKKHQPKFNAVLKDDKTFISLMINHQHIWPMIRLVRYKGQPKEKALYFGPYTSAYAARKTLQLMQKLFPLRQCSDSELKRRTRPCLLYGIKRCIAPCVGLCTKEEYTEFVQGATKFLRGQDKDVLARLYRQMEQAAEKLEFERAAHFQHVIHQVEEVLASKQLLMKPGGKDTDVLGFYREADEVVLIQLMLRQGKLVGSEHYNFTGVIENEEELLESFILQYYMKQPELPDEILIPFSMRQTAHLSQIFQEEKGDKLHFIVPQKGEKKAFVELAQKNAQATFKQEKDHAQLNEKMLWDMADTLQLTHYPRRIECFDTSSLSGTHVVAAQIAFTDGEKDKKRTRFYKVRHIDRSDDYGALREVLLRRLMRGKQEDDLPDLIIVDGGKGQLNVLVQVVKELDIISIDTIAVTKEEAKHTRGLTAEKIYTGTQPEPISLPATSPLLFLLQKIRDATHDAAIGFHRKQRTKSIIKTALDEIEGIGPIKRKRLLKHFGSIKKILEASPDALLSVKGITAKDVERITAYAKQHAMV